jgi:CheY-like chemotaxis protein
VAFELLRHVGFKVDLAENGQIALDRVRANPYDLVLMDMQMPIMDGLTATLEIRKEKRFDDLPVVAMTANAMQGDRDRCLAAGMNDHVAKPIEPEDLWTALLKWIKPQRGMAETMKMDPRTGVDSDLPTGIDGLDVAVGLKRVLGKQQLYLSILRKFMDGQRSAPAAILQAVDRKDWGTAERFAHNLKGVAGTIGALALQDLAQKLETAIARRHPRRVLDAHLHELVTPLETLIARLEQQLPVDPSRTNIMVDQDQLKAVCGRLQALLEEDDAEAGDVLEAHADLIFTAYPSHYRKIENAIRSYDYEAASAALDEAISASVSE